MISHGFTVERTQDADVNQLQQRIKQALDKIVSTAVESQLQNADPYVVVGNMKLQSDGTGPDVPAAGAIAFKRSYQHLFGATAVNFIATTGWFDGARIEILVVNGLTFNHLVAAPPAGAYSLRMLSGANTPKAGFTVIAFRRDDAIKNWMQVA